MRLLLLFDYFPPFIGGAEAVHRSLADDLSQAHEVTVITRRHSSGDASADAARRYRVIRVPVLSRLTQSLAVFFRGLSLARRADLIICSTYASSLAGRWLARAFGRRSVLIVHGYLGDTWHLFKPWPYRAYERFILTLRHDRVVAVSNFVRDAVMALGVPASKVRVIYNGLGPLPVIPDGTPSMGTNSQAAIFNYLYYGRASRSKGIIYLIDAVPLIAKAVPGSVLTLVVFPEPRSDFEHLKRRIRLLGQDAGIELLLSPAADLPRMLRRADVLVFPSLSEGFGLAIAEACQLGKPVVVTRAGAIPEVVSGKVSFCERADSRSLAKAVIRAARGQWENIPQRTFSLQETMRQYRRMIEEAA